MTKQVDWSECPDWCEEDECEAGWHQKAAGIGLVNAQNGGLSVRLNRNYENGNIEIDYWLGGNGSHVFNPNKANDVTTLNSRSDLTALLKELDKFEEFITVLRSEVSSFLDRIGTLK